MLSRCRWVMVAKARRPELYLFRDGGQIVLRTGALFQLFGDGDMERSVRMDMNKTKEIKLARQPLVLLSKRARKQIWVSSISREKVCKSSVR